MSAAVEVGGRTIEVSHPERPYFPDAGLTKGDVVAYYGRIAERMFSHVEGRPLVMQRFPEGLGGSGFMHKEAPDHFPEWVGRATLSKEGGTVTHVVVTEPAVLAYVANYGTLTPHVWTSRAAHPDHPVEIIVDLDPDPDDPGAVPLAARAVKGLLDEMGVAAFANSSGSRGVHIHVPLDGSGSTEAVRWLSRAIADEVARRHPDRLTTEVRKAARRGRLFLDTLRNTYAQHAAAPYAIRALPEAPVAVPLDWVEATSAGFDARRITVANVFRRLGAKGDPWAGMDGATTSVDALAAALSTVAGRA